MIRHTSLPHGWFYHYRVHTGRAKDMPEHLLPLSDFLDKMHTECPHEKFESGPRGSKLRFSIPLDIHRLDGHIISDMAKEAHNAVKKYKTAHSRVEVFMLEKDPQTLAVEVPLWLDPSEHPNFQKIFNSDSALSGHIDLLRIEGDTVWVWDYKPRAGKERYAATQVYCYALMLSRRTGIPLKHFACGYFDEDSAYVFRPEEGLI